MANYYCPTGDHSYEVGLGMNVKGHEDHVVATHNCAEHGGAKPTVDSTLDALVKPHKRAGGKR